jgi:hypothetical protein
MCDLPEVENVSFWLLLLLMFDLSEVGMKDEVLWQNSG